MTNVITPSATVCSGSGSSGGGGGSSGGGGQIVGSGPTASGYINTNPTGTSTALAITSATTASASAPTAATTPAASSTPYQFTLNRQMWDEGPDILALQRWLNANGFPLVSTGWGSPGNEPDTFGLHTYAALIKFQEENNLPATGYLGPLTRALINSQTQ